MRRISRVSDFAIAIPSIQTFWAGSEIRLCDTLLYYYTVLYYYTIDFKLSITFQQITKALRQKDTHDNADNVQRLLICCNRYKSDLHREELHALDLLDQIAQLNERLDNSAKLSRLDQETITELKLIISNQILYVYYLLLFKVPKNEA